MFVPSASPSNINNVNPTEAKRTILLYRWKFDMEMRKLHHGDFVNNN